MYVHVRARGVGDRDSEGVSCTVGVGLVYYFWLAWVNIHKLIKYDTKRPPRHRLPDKGPGPGPPDERGVEAEGKYPPSV